MRIAFFGGSFDPPHCGHLVIADAAMTRLRLDRVLFAPVGRQPLKGDGAATSFEDRCRMVELAIAGHPAFQLSLADAPQPGGQPNYTIHTLQRLQAQLAASDELFCLLGADSFLTMRQWYRAAQLLRLCPLIVAARPGWSLADLSIAMPPGVGPLTRVNSSGVCEEFQAPAEPAGRVTLYVLPDMDADVSATTIRAAFAGGSPAQGVLPPGVVDYIATHQLYSASRA